MFGAFFLTCSNLGKFDLWHLSVTQRRLIRNVVSNPRLSQPVIIENLSINFVTCFYVCIILPLKMQQTAANNNDKVMVTMAGIAHFVYLLALYSSVHTLLKLCQTLCLCFIQAHCCAADVCIASEYRYFSRNFEI